MKRKITCIIALLLCVTAVTLCFSGCTKDNAKSEKLRVVATIFPEYDWAREILGETEKDIDLRLLIGNGVDLHSYQPSMDDIMLVTNCDVFIYVGGESDKWVTDALAQSTNKNMKVVKLMDVLGKSIKAEETVEGMQENDHDHDDDHDHDHEETEYDEHVWLSLNNASVCCDAITDALSKAMPDKAASFKTNNENYKKQLSELDGEYKTAVKNGSTDTIVVGDRFPFRYMTEDYNIKYYAAFSGCSAETEASFETIVFLSGKVDELKLGAIIQTESSDGSVAATIRDNTETADQKILTLDSMQSVTQENIKNGTTYLSVMKKDLEVLSEALSSVRK